LYGNFTLHFDDFILRTAELIPKTPTDAAYIVQSIKNFYFNGTNDINYLKGQRFVDVRNFNLFSEYLIIVLNFLFIFLLVDF